MDILQDYFPYLLSSYYTLDPYLQPARDFISFLQAQITPLISPLTTMGASMAQDPPAIGTIVASVLLIIIGLQILDFARRLLWSATRLLLKVLFWAGLVLLAFAAWRRGVGRTAQDLWGWADEVQAVWWSEYRRWEGYQTLHPKINIGARQPAGYGNPYRNQYGNAGTGWR